MFLNIYNHLCNSSLPGGFDGHLHNQLRERFVPQKGLRSADFDTTYIHYLSLPLYTIILSEPFLMHTLYRATSSTIFLSPQISSFFLSSDHPFFSQYSPSKSKNIFFVFENKIFTTLTCAPECFPKYTPFLTPETNTKPSKSMCFLKFFPAFKRPKNLLKAKTKSCTFWAKSWLSVDDLPSLNVSLRSTKSMSPLRLNYKVFEKYS